MTSREIAQRYTAVHEFRRQLHRRMLDDFAVALQELNPELQALPLTNLQRCKLQAALFRAMSKCMVASEDYALESVQAYESFMDELWVKYLEEVA